MQDYTQFAFTHIRFLSEEIGGRGSCTAEARLAGEYIHDQLEKLGIQNVEYEPFRGRPSTYRPFILLFGAAFMGSLLALFLGSRIFLLAGALMNFLAAWAMLAETQFKSHWARWLSPQAPSRNVTGIVSPSGAVAKKVVLCAHYDTHRTPIFYSSARWQRLFGLLVTGAFLSMAVGTLGFILGGILGWLWLCWLALLIAPWQAFVLGMVLSADFTPFSPGANDNGSGVGVILGLVQHLLAAPLAHTEVHLVFTDCEETGAHGMLAYLERNMESLGEDAVYIVLDEVGTGRVKYITEDGLVIRHKTHPRALDLERHAAAGLDGVALELPGTAYNDALPATMRGRIAVTVCSADPDHAVTGSHWHQMSDKVEFIDLACLQDAHAFTWLILQALDVEIS